MNNIGPLAFLRQHQRNRVYETVVKALEVAHQRDGTQRKDIANFLNVPPSQVSRWLSGPSNWTLNTLSDLLAAAGAEMAFDVAWNKDQRRGNDFHELNETPVNLPQSVPTAASSNVIPGQPSSVPFSSSNGVLTMVVR